MKLANVQFLVRLFKFESLTSIFFYFLCMGEHKTKSVLHHTACKNQKMCGKARKLLENSGTNPNSKNNLVEMGPSTQPHSSSTGEDSQILFYNVEWRNRTWFRTMIVKFWTVTSRIRDSSGKLRKKVNFKSSKQGSLVANGTIRFIHYQCTKVMLF